MTQSYTILPFVYFIRLFMFSLTVISLVIILIFSRRDGFREDGQGSQPLQLLWFGEAASSCEGLVVPILEILTLRLQFTLLTSVSVQVRFNRLGQVIRSSRREDRSPLHFFGPR